jgi:N-acetylneuraminate synthase
MRIADVAIGGGAPVYVVAEMSANHHQRFDEAVSILEAAAAAGANALKLQTYTPDTMTLAVKRPEFMIQGTIWEGRHLHDLYGEAFTPWEWIDDLLPIATRLGLHLFSTPFDESSVDFLEARGVPVYKIASFELTDLPLLRRVAATGRPVIMSTGMATLAEIEESVTTLRQSGCREIALLKCTSAYPAPLSDMNLRTIADLRDRFGVPVGLSDHTLTAEAAVAGVAVGACIVEKHLTLSRSVSGPDSAFSLEPQEFAEMVAAVRRVEQALGRVAYGPSPAEAPSLRFRRSLFVVQPIPAGALLTTDNVRCLRPAAGLAPRFLDEIIGRRATRDLEPGTPLSWQDVV